MTQETYNIVTRGLRSVGLPAPDKFCQSVTYAAQCIAKLENFSTSNEDELHVQRYWLGRWKNIHSRLKMEFGATRESNGKKHNNKAAKRQASIATRNAMKGRKGSK